jgi:serine/threonine protein kinase
MICPRCSVGEISETTQECLVCGFSPTGGVMVDSADWNRLDDPVTTALERQFQVEGVLRRGAASRIYLARDQVSGRLCSLKVLPLAPFTSTSVTERFRQDAQHAANLDHPHLVAVDRFGVTDTALWYAMEYVQGRSLGDLLPTADRMDLKTCLRLIEQVASALEYGHRRGMVHGNLKPSNVLVDPEGWARVADFGVNGAFGPLPRRQPELSYEDNYGHVAPEQFGANGTVEPASDQYALAVLVFSCLARRLPFAGDTLEEITLQHLEGPVPLLAETRPELPDYVSPALARAMNRDPGARFASVLDFATALAGVSLPERPAAVPVPAESHTPAEARQAPEPIAVAAIPSEEESNPAPPPQSVTEAAEAEVEPAEEATGKLEGEREPETEVEPEAEPAAAEASAAAQPDASEAAPAPEPKVPAESAPAHPPLLFVERGRAAPGDDEEEDLDDEDREERGAERAPVFESAHGEEEHDTEKKPDRKSREPVLLWRASREHPVVAPAAKAVEGEHGDGESPEAAPPLLFMDKTVPARTKAWKVAALRAAARLHEWTDRWQALPRNTRIGSGAGAGVLVVLLAVVWWRVARGHEEVRTDWVGETPPVSLGDSTPSTPPEPPRTQPRTRSATQNTTPAVAATQPSPAGSTRAGGSTPPKPVAGATEPAHLFLNATPWGLVFIDDEHVGHTPMEALVTPGYHVIRISRDGYAPFQREIAIESGEKLRLTDIVLQENPQ